MNFFRFYNRMLVENPIPTKMVTSGIIFGAGDCIAQNIIEKKDKYDVKRTAKLMLVGSVFMAPVLHKWFDFIPRFTEQVVGKKFPNLGTVGRTAFMVSADQFIFATALNSYFFIVTNLIEHQSLNKGFESIQNKLGITMIANWKIWPLAMIINFTFVPLPYRVLFANCVGLVWNTYLSNIHHSH